MKISVLICTYKRKALLMKTLDALLAQSYPASELETIIIDDAGADGAFEAASGRESEFLSKGFRSFRVFRNDFNRGLGFGREFLGLNRLPDSTAVLYLDDDVYLEAGTIGGLVACLEREPSCGMAGPRLVYASQPGKTAHCANFIKKWSGRYTELDAARQTSCDWLNSSCLLVRTAAFASAAWVGESFYIMHEEADFCLQLKKAGFTIMYCPEYKAAHDLPLNDGSRRDKFYYLYRNKLLVFKRNFPFLRRLTATGVLILLGLPRYLLESVRYNGRINTKEIKHILRGVLDGLLGRGGKLPPEKDR